MKAAGVARRGSGTSQPSQEIVDCQVTGESRVSCGRMIGMALDAVGPRTPLGPCRYGIAGTTGSWA